MPPATRKKPPASQKALATKALANVKPTPKPKPKKKPSSKVQDVDGTISDEQSLEEESSTSRKRKGNPAADIDYSKAAKILKKGSTLPEGFNEETYAQFLKWMKKKNEKNKESFDVETQQIRDRNRDMMANENSEQEEEGEHPTMPTNGSHTPPVGPKDFGLTPEEIQFASTLKQPTRPQIIMSEDEEEHNKNNSDHDRQENDADEGDIYGAEQNWEDFGDNGITHRNIDNHSVRLSSRTSSSGGTQRTKPRSDKSGKTVSSDFSPITRKVAYAARTQLRSSLVFGTTFPPNQGAARLEYCWKEVEQMVKSSGNASYADAFSRAASDLAIKKNIINFSLAARNNFLSEIGKAAREQVKPFYALTGAPGKIHERVKWLMQEARYLYGGIDYEKQVVDPQKPFGCDLIAEIIELMWFPASSRAKVAQDVAAKTLAMKTIPETMILLVTTAIECALHEWYSGSKRNTPFTDEVASKAFAIHQARWQALEKSALAWTKWFKKQLFEKICAEYNNGFVKAETIANDFKNTDFDALNQMAAMEGTAE
ncbi:hypothetical protein B0H34DRAFT_797366 [Crassisporium funariophilum]|nr:hypothetical protein B0H34DRAFT_797366 [Crassisporium funariophilum]